MSHDTLDPFTRQYLETALWASTGDDDAPLDRDYGLADFAPESLATACDDCERFQAHNAGDLELAYATGGYDAGRAGHDFFLTRNGHGVGFWDRDLGDVGDRLTAAAHGHGEAWVYVGDDGLIYLSAG